MVKDTASFGIIFVALAVVFLGIAFRDYLNGEGKLGIVRKIWIRTTFIFASVGIGLFFVQILFH